MEFLNKIFQKNLLKNKNNVKKEMKENINKERKEEIEKIKNVLILHLFDKSRFFNKYLYPFFYKYNLQNHIDKKYYDKIELNHTYNQNMINIKKSRHCINTRRETSFVYDEILMKSMKNIQYIESLKMIDLKRKIRSDRRETFFLYTENRKKYFCKKMIYRRRQSLLYDQTVIEYDIHDNIMEIFIQTRLYEYSNKKIQSLTIVPEINHFINCIEDNIDMDEENQIVHSNGYMYVFMEKMEGITLDMMIYKMFYIPFLESKKIRHNIKIFYYTMIHICVLLEELQRKLNFVHGDLKGSNIIVNYINEELNIHIIDFEFSYIKENENSFYSHDIFLFDDNYKTMVKNSEYHIDLVKLYTSQYRFCSDLMYLLLALNRENDIFKEIYKDFFEINGVNMYDILLKNVLPYEAFVFSKNFELLYEICYTNNVIFVDFIERFRPCNAVKIFNKYI